jgi:hypothetical protein
MFMHTVSVGRAGVAAVALTAAMASSHAAQYDYSFHTFYDPTTSDAYDTRSLFEAVATLSVSDVAGGVQLSLTQPQHSLASATTAGTFLKTLWFNGPIASWTSTSGLAPLASSGRLSAPVTLDGGLSYRWRFDFADNAFAEGNSATWTLTGTGITAQSFVNSAGWPMLTLTNAGMPFGVTPGGRLNFVALTPVAAIPEPASVALFGLGLLALAAWRGVRSQPRIRPAVR